MRRTFALLALVATLGLAVVACSSGGSSGSDDASATDTSGSIPGIEGKVNEHGTAKPEDGKVELELDDFYFGPTYIEAKAGEKLTIELENEGSTEHNFTLTGTDVDVDVEPGDTMEVSVTVPDESTVYFCEYHQKSGMQGGFVVT